MNPPKKVNFCCTCVTKHHQIVQIATRIFSEQFLILVAFILASFSVSYSQNFTTVASGNWNDPAIWSSTPTTPGYPDATAGTITINTAHTVTIPLGVDITIDQLTVKGTLTINSSVTLSDGSGADLTLTGASAIVNINGVLAFANNASSSGCTSLNTTFLAGSRYRHLHQTLEGIIPLAKWNATSTLEIAGYTTFVTTTSSGNWTQTFGHVEWNCSLQSTQIKMGGRLTAITGDFSVLNTGTGILELANNQVATISVGGNLNITGTSQVYFSTAPAAGTSIENLTVNIGKNFSFTSTNPVGSEMNEKKQTVVNLSGDFYMNAPGGKLVMATKPTNVSSTDGTVFNIVGNLQLVAGEVYALDIAGGRIGDFRFAGPANTVHTYSNTGIMTGAINYKVLKDNILRTLGESAMAGGVFSTFNLGEPTGGATLIVESTDPNGAIQIGQTAGNLRVGNATKRIYYLNSVVIYNGPAAQYIGTGQPGSTNAGTATTSLVTVIDNSFGVSLNSTAATVTVAGELRLSNGDLTVTKNNLTVLGDISLPSGSIYVNTADATVAAKNLTANGKINLTVGQIHFISGTANGDNATLTVSGAADFTGTNYFTFTGPNCRLTINSGTRSSFTRPFPVDVPINLEVVTINRPTGVLLEMPQDLSVGRIGNNSSGLFLTSGSLKMNADLTAVMVARVTSGTLFFEDHTIELQRNINTTYPTGVFSANASSTLNITGTFAGNTNVLSFSPSGNTLGTLLLNRPASVTPHVTLNSPLTITGNLYLTDGEFENQSGLSLDNLANIVRTTDAAFSSLSVAPDGGPYNIVYNNGVTSSLTTGIETEGNVQNVITNLTGTLTSGHTLTVQGDLTLASGVFDNTSNLLLMNNNSNLIRHSGSTITGVTPAGGPYNLVYEGTAITTGLEAQGELNDVTSNSSGTVTLISNLTSAGILTINDGVWSSGVNNISASAFTNQATFNAPGTLMQINGAFTNDGVFNHSNGTVEFIGNAAIQGGSNPVFNHLSITETGILNSPVFLDLQGNFINNGTFDSNNGTVRFTGSVTQNITGAVITNFNNITVSNTSVPSVSIETGQNLIGQLTLASNTKFDADGSLDSATFTLVSSNDAPAIDASITTLPLGAVVTGKVNVQRYMSDENRLYRYISSSTTNATMADWMDDFPVTGDFKDPSKFPQWPKVICGFSLVPKSASLFYYDETIHGASSKGYVAYPKKNTFSYNSLLAVGKGYVPYIRECSKATIIDVKGPVNQGIINIPVTYTNTPSDSLSSIGWNLVGNPYPSAIDWNQDGDLNSNGSSLDVVDGWTKTNIAATIAIHDNGSGTVRYWDGDVAADDSLKTIANGIIAMGQGFWVRTVAASPQLIIREGVKSKGTSEFFRKATIPAVIISLKKDGIEDITYVKIRDNAQQGLDYWDAPKINNDVVNIATISTDKISMAINALPELTCGTEIKISMAGLVKGVYTMRVANRGEFDGHRIELLDKFLKTSRIIDWNESFTFSVTADLASKDANRLSLKISEKEPHTIIAEAPLTICHTDATIKVINSQEGVYYSAWSIGGNKLTSDYGGRTNLSMLIDKNLLVHGQNNVVLKAQNSCGVYDVSNSIQIMYETPAVEHIVGDSSCLPGSVNLAATSTEQDGTLNWYASMNEPTAVYHGEKFTTPILTETKTYFVSVTTSSGCESERSEVNATVIEFEPATITASGNVLTSNYNSSTQWYLNNIPIQGATGSSLVVDKSGIYSTVTTFDHCEARADYTYEITGIENLDDDLMAYPNPVKDFLYVRVPSNEIVQDAYLVNATGIRLSTVPAISDKQNLNFNMSDLADGFYVLKVATNNSNHTFKVIKVNTLK